MTRSGGADDDLLERVHGGRGAGHGVSALGQRADEGMADRRVVFHQQELRHIADGSRAAIAATSIFLD